MSGGWASLGLLPEFVQTLENEYGFALPTAIQEEAIPLILGGADVMAAAETGSGKTLAFALPVLQLCLEHKEQQSKRSDKGLRVAYSDSAPSWRISGLDRDSSIAIQPNSEGTLIQARDPSNFSGCRATLGVDLRHVLATQSWSYSCRILDDGIIRIGWATADASLQLGTDGEGWGYGSTGVKVYKKNYQPYGNGDRSFCKGDVIGCHLRVFAVHTTPDKEENQETKRNDHVVAVISYTKNEVLLGDAFEIRRSDLSELSLYPAVCIKNGECRLHFDSDQPFEFPSGYQPLATMPLNQAARNPRDVAATFGSPGLRGPLAIVIEPTRDLAEQTFQVFQRIALRIRTASLNVALLVGGISPKRTLANLRDNKVDVLVGTSPIISSYMKRNTVEATRCKYFVIDEADELILTDSVQHINSIYSRLRAVNHDVPRFDRLQVCFFSATLDKQEVRNLADDICREPLWIKLRSQTDSLLPDTVQHCFVSISPDSFAPDVELIKSDAVHRQGKLDKAIALSDLSKEDSDSEKIKQLKFRAMLAVMDKLAMDQVLVFCRTNLDCDLLEAFLKSQEGVGDMVKKYSCCVLAGMRSTQERQKSLEAFRNGVVRILVATDVAARGIDVKELPFMINFTLPDNVETYVHRVGRVGRSERLGLALSLISTVKERVWYCQSGRRPPCDDTRDFEKGGNCRWYDEPLVRQQIMSVLSANNVIPTMVSYPGLKFPASIRRHVKRKDYGNSAQTESCDPELVDKVQSLRQQVQKIQDMEAKLQDDYWRLRRASTNA